MVALREASGTETAPAFVRLRAAAALGQLAASRDVGSPSALQGYQTAIGLLPVLAWRGLTVELLEQGRAVMWSQLPETRSDLADLDGADHETALRLRELRNIFDVGAEPAP